ncbi:MAG: LAGLIDADG family homing endonuclease [Candidatus Helarchaeota archaeon]
MGLNIEWLMGFIEAKGTFVISQQKIKRVREKSLSKEELLQKLSKILPKSDPGFLNSIIFENLLTLNKRKLLKACKEALTLRALENEDFRYYEEKYFLRPAFSLTFNAEDENTVRSIKHFFEGLGINVNGPYQLNKGKNLRIEVKGIKNCLKIYDFLKDKDWYTSKKEKFEKWGKSMFEKFQA